MKRWFDDKENFFEDCIFKFGNHSEKLKPFPTCETCDYIENCDIWDALLSAGYTLQNAFCPKHQDFANTDNAATSEDK